MTETPELSTVDALAQLSFLVQAMVERHAAAQDVTAGQTRLLGVLRDRRPTINELARLLELDKSSVSGLVDRAQRRGLVARVPSEHDGRSVLVELTDSGRAIVTAAASGFASEIDQLVGRLAPAERAQLTALVSRVVAQHAAAHGIDLRTEPAA